MKLYVAVLVFVAAALFARAGECATEIDRIVAIVGPQAVTLSELETEMAPALNEISQRMRGDELAAAVDKLKRSTLNNLIDKYLQLQEAKVQGIEVTEEEVNSAIDDIMKKNKLDKAGFTAALAGEGYAYDDYKKVLMDQLTILRLVSRAVKSRISIKEDEVQEYYKKNKARFASPETVRVANIFFPAKDGDFDTALKNAEDAKKAITDGASFEEMAAKCTGDPGAAKTCVLGSFAKGELSKAIEEKAFAMEAGQVSEPIKLDTGYQLIKVMEHAKPAMKTVEEARAQIVDDLQQKEGEALFSSWLQDLRKHTYVEIRN